MSFDSDQDDATGIQPTSDAEREAWRLTNEDMEAIAAERREEGYDATTVTAVHTNPVDSEHGDVDRFGFEYVVPGNQADDVEAAFERADGVFPDFVVYRREVTESAFMVVELLDPETMTALVVASHYDRRRAGGLVKASVDAGETYSHLVTLDGTLLGSVRHEEFDPFFPSDDEPDTSV
jgi:hypothetical protein